MNHERGQCAHHWLQWWRDHLVHVPKLIFLFFFVLIRQTNLTDLPATYCHVQREHIRIIIILLPVLGGTGLKFRLFFCLASLVLGVS